MKLYIKQKVFSIKDSFDIYDEEQNTVYTCESQLFSVGKKLHLFTKTGDELALIRQRFSFLPKFTISKSGEDVTDVVKKLSFLKPVYDVPGFGWTVTGNFSAHEYTISHGERAVAVIAKKWFSWGDTYEVFSVRDSDMENVLCVVLVIDAIMAVQSRSSSSAN